MEEAFWFLKSYFKGDSEFTYDSFYSLPCEYLISAYMWAHKQQKAEMHLLERPVALMTAQQSNINRDPKKKKTPYMLEDFYLYQSQEDQALPSARYGAAAVQLVKDRMFPSFALFCFAELNKNAGTVVPTIVAFLHPNAVLLAPTELSGEVTGLLIAEVGVSGKVISMESPCGQRALIQMPLITDEVMAEEDITLRLG